MTTLVPAYGRDYKSKKAAFDDFEAGKDFIIADITSRWDGKLANIESFKRMGVSEVFIRFNRLTKCYPYTIK